MAALTFNNITADSFITDTHPGQGRRRPRYREPLSCTQCRDRKVRCDRNKPCRQCQSRNLSSTCRYASSRGIGSFSQQQRPPPARRSHTAPSSPSSSPNESSLQNRSERRNSLLAASSAPPSEAYDQGSSTAANTPDFTHTAIALYLQDGSPLSAKTRLVSGTHWLAVCNNMVVLRAMLNKSIEFADSRSSFAEIKAWTKSSNSMVQTVRPIVPDAASLHALLPPRNVCDKWLRVYAHTYRYIYDIVDEITLNSVIDAVWIQANDDNIHHLCILLLIVCIGMQADENERLTGRTIARQIEHFVHTSNLAHKPCATTMMILLLLGYVKTLSCSDAEPLDSLASIFGLAYQVALSMGLHRDSTTLGSISTYHNEIRNRLWAIFFRMYLEYCTTVGIPCALREEDITTELPSNMSLATAFLDGGSENAAKILPHETEVTFSIVAARLALIAAPYQRAICSAKETVSPDAIQQINERLKTLLAEVPAYMHFKNRPTDRKERLQQAYLTILMHSIKLMVHLHFILKSPPDPSQKANLDGIWEQSLSVVQCFKVLTQRSTRLQPIAFQLLWSSTCRAAFSASMALNRMRLIESDTFMSNKRQHTLIPYQKILMTHLTFLSQFWFGFAPLGPVASKNCLLLAVVVAVTTRLFDEDQEISDQELIKAGAQSVSLAVESMKQNMQRRYDYPLSDRTTFVSPNFGPSLGRILGSTDRSVSSPNLTSTWRSASDALDSPAVSTNFRDPISATTAPVIDLFAQSLDPTFGHPFIPSENAPLSYNSDIMWSMDQHDFTMTSMATNTNSVPHQNMAGLTIHDHNYNVRTAAQMNGLVASTTDWQTAHWISEMSMPYSND